MRQCPQCGRTYPDDRELVSCPEDGAPLDEVERRSLAGTTLDGRYRLEERIGVGGLGEIYRARHLRMDRAFAIKLLQPSVAGQSDFVGRFDREAQALSRLDHPCCVAVTDYGVCKTHGPYIVMELVDGEPLSTFTRGEGLPLQTALELVSMVLLGLQHAHEQGIVHRDIKPDNIMIVDRPLEPARLLPKILDFGLAKIRAGFGPTGRPLTQAGFIVGTPHYIAPERVTDATGADDPRSDVYAVGVILFELCCGRRPFVADDIVQVVQMHLTQPPPSPRSIRPDLPRALEAVILRALEKRLEDRFPSAAAFREAVDALLPLPPELGKRLPKDPVPEVVRSETKIERPSRMPAAKPEGATTEGKPGGAPASDESQLLWPRSWRWPLLVGAGVVVMVLAATTIVVLVDRATGTGASGKRAASTKAIKKHAVVKPKATRAAVVRVASPPSTTPASIAAAEPADDHEGDDSAEVEPEPDPQELAAQPEALRQARKAWSNKWSRNRAASQFMRYLAKHRDDAAAHVYVGRLYLYALWTGDGLRLVQRGLKADPKLRLDTSTLMALALAYRGSSMGTARRLIDAHASGAEASRVLLAAAAAVSDRRVKQRLVADARSRRATSTDPLSRRLLDLAEAKKCEPRRRALQALGPDADDPAGRVMLSMLRASRCLRSDVRRLKR